MTDIIVGFLFFVFFVCLIGRAYYKSSIKKMEREHEEKKRKKNEQAQIDYHFKPVNSNQYRVHKQLITTYKTAKNKYVDDFVVIDVETTGLYPETDEIIQLSAIKYINNVEASRFNEYINPKRSIPINVSRINGIYDKDVINKPTLDVILPLFVEFIENYTLIAHNASFDMKFIQTSLNYHNYNLLENKVIDTLGLARSCISTENHKLETLKCYLGINAQSHNSIEDCYVTGLLYFHCKRTIEKMKMEANQFLRNNQGNEYEKNGDINKAIELYEKNIEENFEGNHPYDRLAIIYRKLKRPEDEIRVLEKAIYVFENVVNNERADRITKLQKFNERLEKIKSKVS